ncbi:MAG: AAA family ATPase [Candidatus Saganbacteria bacterium]|nr:AAA family ATPase [Candidatus Saganbacteria bacterium]
MTVRLIPRQAFNANAYSIFGIPKKNIQQSTVNLPDGQYIDCGRLAELTGRSEIAIEIAALKADLPVERISLDEETGINNSTLKRIKEVFAHINLVKKKGPQWMEGFSNPDLIPLLETVCAVLLDQYAKKSKLPLWNINTQCFIGNHRKGIKPIRLEEINIPLSGMLSYFRKQPERKNQDAIDFMFNKLGIPELKELPMSLQFEVMKKMDRIPWDKVSLATQRFLVERLAQKAGVPIQALATSHFGGAGKGAKRINPIFLEEINCSLSGFHIYYNKHSERNGQEVIHFILKHLRIPYGEELPIEQQLEVIKKTKRVYWEYVPLSTKMHLLERLAKKAGKPLWQLDVADFRIELDEIGSTLGGLYGYYQAHPERGNLKILDFICLRMGFQELSQDEQLNIMKKWESIPWAIVPEATQKYLLECLAKKAETTLWNLIAPHFTGDKRGKYDSEPIVLNEINAPLRSLYTYYFNHPERNKDNVIRFMFARAGIKQFEDLSIDLQINIIKRMDRYPWERIPIATQRHLVELLAQKVGVSVWNLTTTHFKGLKKAGVEPIFLDEINETLKNLFDYWSNHPKRRGKPILDFMLSQLGFGIAPFDPSGRLFTGSWENSTNFSPLRSLHVTLQAIRILTRDWKEQNPDKSIVDIKKKDLDLMLRGNPKYEGLTAVHRGLYFDYSFGELFALAHQHVPLDELEPETTGVGNILLASMFKPYPFEGNDEPTFISGWFSNRKRDREIPLLIDILKNQIKLQGPDFDPAWLMTQKMVLEGQPLSEPLLYALGKQGPLPNSQPNLAPEIATYGMDLNPSQDYAARMMLDDSNPLVVVHGPAGTGKTHMLEPVISKLVRSGKKVLYVSPTHKATDVFLGRINNSSLYSGIPTIRLAANDKKMTDTAREYWINNPNAVASFKAKQSNCDGMLFLGTPAAGIHFLNQNSKKTRERLFTERVHGVRIFRDLKNYDVIVFDEASMGTKAEAYTLFPYAKRGIILGDHIQLEPSSIDQKITDLLKMDTRQIESAQRCLLEELMFANYPRVLLDANYRAINPTMILLASRLFYDERIRINQRGPYFLLTKPLRDKKYPKESLRIIDTSALPAITKKEEKDFSHSFYNHKEADLVLREVSSLLASGFNLDDIAIITPYNAQVDLIRRKIRIANPGVPDSYLERWVSTFDGFQGDENKCTIISFVRSNQASPPRTGFVGNYHRVNVALTRAMERMILIGDWSTLKKTGARDFDPTDKLSRQTRYIFEELEKEVRELEDEGRAQIVRLH